MEQGGHNQSVLNTTRLNQAHHFVLGHQSREDILGVIKIHGMTQGAILDEHKVAGVTHDGRVRKNLADDARAFAFVTGFFATASSTKKSCCSPVRGETRMSERMRKMR